MNDISPVSSRDFVERYAIEQARVALDADKDGNISESETNHSDNLKKSKDILAGYRLPGIAEVKADSGAQAIRAGLNSGAGANDINFPGATRPVSTNDGRTITPLNPYDTSVADIARLAGLSQGQLTNSQSVFFKIQDASGKITGLSYISKGYGENDTRAGELMFRDGQNISNLGSTGWTKINDPKVIAAMQDTYAQKEKLINDKYDGDASAFNQAMVIRSQVADLMGVANEDQKKQLQGILGQVNEDSMPDKAVSSIVTNARKNLDDLLQVPENANLSLQRFETRKNELQGKLDLQGISDEAQLERAIEAATQTQHKLSATDEVKRDHEATKFRENLDRLEKHLGKNSDNKDLKSLRAVHDALFDRNGSLKPSLGKYQLAELSWQNTRLDKLIQDYKLTSHEESERAMAELRPKDYQPQLQKPQGLELTPQEEQFLTSIGFDYNHPPAVRDLLLSYRNPTNGITPLDQARDTAITSAVHDFRVTPDGNIFFDSEKNGLYGNVKDASRYYAFDQNAKPVELVLHPNGGTQSNPLYVTDYQDHSKSSGYFARAFSFDDVAGKASLC